MALHEEAYDCRPRESMTRALASGVGRARHLIKDHSRNSQSGGHGLGLSIAKRIAENQQGSLLLSNRQGGGLCVRIFIAQRKADTRPSTVAHGSQGG